MESIYQDVWTDEHEAVWKFHKEYDAPGSAGVRFEQIENYLDDIRSCVTSEDFEFALLTEDEAALEIARKLSVTDIYDVITRTNGRITGYTPPKDLGAVKEIASACSGLMKDFDGGNIAPILYRMFKDQRRIMRKLGLGKEEPEAVAPETQAGGTDKPAAAESPRPVTPRRGR